MVDGLGMNLEEIEVLFAQKLASGEPRIRRKSFDRLRKWFCVRIKAGHGRFFV